MRPLTPKQVARALGVSESSLKRWCDRGVISSDRTAGGHRRIPLREVLRFLRDHQKQLVRPDVLGLPPGTGIRPRVVNRAENNFTDALLAGDTEVARRVIFDLFINGAHVVDICEDVVTPALHEIGDQWECGAAEIYQERHACEVTGGLLYELRMLLPPVAEHAPLAIGGTPSGDDYRLPTQMVELVLGECGWRATSLGSSLPTATLSAAAEKQKPDLFWLSVSHVEDDAELTEGLRELRDHLPATIQLVLGGQSLKDAHVEAMQPATVCTNLRELHGLAAKSRAG